MSSASLSNAELESLPSLKSSWHWDHRDTNTVGIARLPFEMNEMDILIMFSQWGPIASLKLLRDKFTGKSKGVAFLRYEQWESAVCCVDNFNGVGSMGKGIRVDHSIFRGYRYDNEVEGGDANKEWDEAVSELLADQIVEEKEQNTELLSNQPETFIDDDLEDPMAEYLKGKKA